MKIVWNGAASNEISSKRTLIVSLTLKVIAVDVEDCRWHRRWGYLHRKSAKIQLNVFVCTWTRQALGSEFVQLPLS